MSNRPACSHTPTLGHAGVRQCDWEHHQNEMKVGKESSSKGEEIVVRPVCMKMNAARTPRADWPPRAFAGHLTLLSPFSPVVWSSLTRQLCAAGFLHWLHEEEFPFPRPERGGCGIVCQITGRTYESASCLGQGPGPGAGQPGRRG